MDAERLNFNVFEKFIRKYDLSKVISSDKFNSAFMNIKNVTIIGSGNLGTRIGLQAAISGYQVIFYDVSENVFESSRKSMDKILSYLIHSNKLKDHEIEGIKSRIKFTMNLSEALSQADIVSESVTEELTVKQKVWAEIGKLANTKTILTTNTSYLLPSQIAAFTGRPEKFCAFHFHDVFYSRIVDIMPHPTTDESLIELLKDFGRKLNQVPVVIKKESPGYIFNTLLMAVLSAAGRLKTLGIADIEDIDKSWMVNFNMPTGPFGILDNIGLDTAWHVVKERKDPSSVAFAELLKGYLDAGKLGEKSGEGFYQYPNPAFKRKGFLV
jgi:3-hydroxybutyryl-CoA dehydrogenase